MAVPSCIHPYCIATKSMALVLILALTASLSSHYAVAATGGVMGGGFSVRRGGFKSSATYTSNCFKDDHGRRYRPRSATRTHTHVYQYNTAQNSKPTHQNGSSEEDHNMPFHHILTIALIFVVMSGFLLFFYNNPPKNSIVKLQVALKGTACPLQKDLNHIARKADTSTQEGYKYVLEESAKALLKHSEFWLSSYLSEKTRSNEFQAESLFNELSFEERSKFDEETLINIDSHQDENNDWEIVAISPSPFIVVNIIVATTGHLNLSPICTASDLKAVLMKLGGLAKSELLAVHVLWTPQDENDHLSRERLQQDYPLLMFLRTKLD